MTHPEDHYQNIRKNAYQKLTQYLTDNAIPFYFTKLYDNSHDNSYIIPGALIRVLAKGRFLHEDGICSYEHTISKLAQDEFTYKIYIYIYNIDDTDTFCAEDLHDSNAMSDRGLDITFINDPSEIVVAPFIYQIDTCGPLYTFAVDKDVVKYSKYTYYVSKNQYQRASVYMTDAEIASMNRVKLEIVDELPNNQYKVFPTNRQKPKHKNYFTQFHMQMKYIPLPGGFRPPIRFIDGYTSYCILCNRLYDNRFINEKKECPKCVQ